MSSDVSLRAARVRVPCSTSNLGSGYDTIGLALDRYLDVTFRPDDSGELRLQRTGTLARLDEDDGPDLVASMFTRQVARGRMTPSGVLHMHSEIPIARGLGTSAAAALAGYDLARAVRGEPGTMTARSLLPFARRAMGTTPRRACGAACGRWPPPPTARWSWVWN